MSVVSKNIIISNLQELDRLKEVFKEQGKDKIHVLADFDRTLTKAFVNDEKISSIISILRKENILNEEYTKVTSALFEKYHPIEIDPNMPVLQKKKKMEEWWRAHNAELLKHGLNKKHLDKVIASANIKFRAGALDFLDLLKENDIPLVIISSSGLGGYVISRLFAKAGKDPDNINIISNNMEFDEAGEIISFSEPVIHVLNKDETVVKNFPQIYDKIKIRSNVILLGDGIEDIGMVVGFDYDNIIKIGFLNYDLQENLEAFKQNFDIIILNDGPMDYANNLLKEII